MVHLIHKHLLFLTSRKGARAAVARPRAAIVHDAESRRTDLQLATDEGTQYRPFLV